MTEQSVKVVLLGESGVGKSSLALRFVTDEFRPYSEATIGASFMSKQITIPSCSSTSDNGKNVEQLFKDVATRIPPPTNLNESLEEDVGLDLGESGPKSSCC